MKKYVKPELFYESFELSQHIAGCNLQINYADVINCKASGTVGTYNIESDSWFLEQTVAGCSPTLEVYCYTNGSMTAATVNS